MSKTTVWLAGRSFDYGVWEILGIFSTESAAVEACTEPSDFVGPVQLDVRLPDATLAWPGSYFPRESAKVAAE